MTQSGTPELLVQGVIPTLYRDFVSDVYNRLKSCASIQEAKSVKFAGRKPGSLYVCADRDSIIFFERKDQVFARIKFQA